MEKKKIPTKRKQTIKEENKSSSKIPNKIPKEKSKKQEKKKEIKIKILTKKQLIIICSIITICILGTALCIFIVFSNKETKIETCSVQFNTNGGIEMEQISIVCGGTIKEPDIPYKEGFDFVGWYLDGEEYDFLSKVNKNLVVEAKWNVQEGVKLVTVSFDTNGGSKQDDIELKKGTYLTKPVDPTKKGYSFVGWYLDGKEFLFISNPIDKNITLKAKWKKTNKDSTISDKENSFDTIFSSGDTTNQDNNGKIDILYKYDDIVKKYVGIWYLKGYEDIFLEVNRTQYYDGTVMNFYSTNFSMVVTMGSSYKIEKAFVKYPCSTKEDRYYGCSYDNSAHVQYENWSADLKKEKIKLNPNSIDINGNVFVRNKGNKNKYTGTTFEKALGKWYLYNKPDSYLEIYSSGDVNDVGNTLDYCIKYNSFNMTNFQYNQTGTTYCDKATSEELFEKYGIVVSGDKLTVNNTNGTRTFYKTKKIINVSGITLNESSININIGDVANLSASVNPKDAYNSSYVWSSSNNNVATVSSSGKVTAKGEGTATITVKTNDGGYTDKCVVNVKSIKVNSVSLNKKSISLVKGDTETLRATINPNNATSQNVTWSSSDSNIATVSSDGKITAKSKGTVTITVKTNDGGYTDNCTVTVTNPPLIVDASIGIRTTVSNSGASRYLYANVTASGGSGVYTYYYIKVYKDGTLIRSSSNTSINELLLLGHTNGSYTMEYEVRDSDGTIKTGTSSTTISGF